MCVTLPCGMGQISTGWREKCIQGDKWYQYTEWPQKVVQGDRIISIQGQQESVYSVIKQYLFIQSGKKKVNSACHNYLYINVTTKCVSRVISYQFTHMVFS